MIRPVTLIVLTKYPEIWERFKSNVETLFDLNSFYRVVVLDGKLVPEPKNWLCVYGPKKFSMAGNANMGWRQVARGTDILYVGDDVTFTSPDTLEKLSELAHSDPAIGMLSPHIIGGADNPLQKNPDPSTPIQYSEKYLALVCTFIKQEVIQSVGYLDEETFKGYGWEDADYNRRVQNAGYKLAVTPLVKVHHGFTRQGTETFMRNVGGYYEDIQAQCDENERAYIKKWGDNKR